MKVNIKVKNGAKAVACVAIACTVGFGLVGNANAATAPATKADSEQLILGSGSTELRVTKGTASKTVTAQSSQLAAAATTPSATANTLVLYDTGGQWGKLGELYAMNVANLTGHFGAFTARPVSTYTAGQMNNFTATIYIGSTYDEALPGVFLTDVATSTKPVIWMNHNIWQLTANTPDFQSKYGFMPWFYDNVAVSKVSYKGRDLTRSSDNAAGIMSYSAMDASKATVLASAVRSDGTSSPWAVRSGNLTYIGEIPFAYVNETDRQLIFADLLFDALAPATPERHRALVRIEDVGPDSDPAELRAIADYLSSQNVPFSFGVFPRFRNPNGIENNGVAEEYTLKQRPEVVAALRYMTSKGGTMLMHGWTHQLTGAANPYDGLSGNDFEFFAAHVDANDRVILDGPVPGDSVAWATGRINSSKRDFQRAKLPVPTIFEFPHYAGSAADYKAVRSMFTTRYERSLYFYGGLSGTIDNRTFVGQLFPYTVNDIYGSKVLPENLGNYEPEAYNHHPARHPADLVASAQANLIVRDGFASFFYHPFLGTEALAEIVTGIKAAGYTFVSPASL